jgi:PAS domain S-box-containing protein
MQKIEILYGERSRDDVELTLREFKKHRVDFKVDVAATGVECLEKLAEKSYDIVLLDYKLPMMNGLEVLKVIKDNYDVPVVIVTGRGDEEVAVRAMKLGAYDYVIKTADYLGKLPLVIQNAIAKYRADKEKTKLEAEIRSLKDYLEKIYNTADDPIYVIDYEGKFRDVNKKAEEVTGYKKEELVGMDFTEILAPESLEIAVENFRKRIQGEYVPPYEIEIISKRGERVPLEIRASRLEGVGEIGIARDVTERKRLEKELREHAATLERSNKLKDLFIDIMGHDLLNSLTIIQGVVSMLRKEEGLRGYEAELCTLEKNANRLIKMVEDVKVFAKLRGLEELEFAETDLAEVAREVINEYRGLASSKGIEIIYKFPEKSLARVSPFIRHVFDNLLSNAIKYSPEKSRIIMEIKDEGEVFEIVVKDYGIGIPDGYKKAVFERFERGGKRGVRGTGLGLAIVKRVVELHRGRVWVEDNIIKYTDEKGRIHTKKQGSVFHVTIPKS